nr:MerR family transcriptional regulator [Actinomycetota bacterium]
TELAAAAGLDDAQVAELESFGLLTPAPQSGDHPVFDEEALTIARMAAGFYRHGIETRHLRMYKHFAQREAALFEQVLLAYLRQRNPEARAKAQTELAELAQLGRGLRAALLVTAVREVLAD